MDTLEAMAIFIRVVERGSFSAVAREVGFSQPTISKQIGALDRGDHHLLVSSPTAHGAAAHLLGFFGQVVCSAVR